VDLCKECLHAKYQEKLDQYNGCCQNCASPPTPIHEPVDTSNSTFEPEHATPLPEPDITLVIVEQLRQQVKTQNQLILQL